MNEILHVLVTEHLSRVEVLPQLLLLPAKVRFPDDMDSTGVGFGDHLTNDLAHFLSDGIFTAAMFVVHEAVDVSHARTLSARSQRLDRLWASPVSPRFSFSRDLPLKTGELLALPDQLRTESLAFVRNRHP